MFLHGRSTRYGDGILSMWSLLPVIQGLGHAEEKPIHKPHAEPSSPWRLSRPNQSSSLAISYRQSFTSHEVVCNFSLRTPTSSSDLGSLHQAAVLATGVKLRHGNSCPPAVELDEDFHDPFVPHLAVVGLAPHADFDFGVVGHVDGGL